tara:strand:+ start:92 stop:271 length:180 start_codon:yes stop_codon:yes gene_type:complete
MRTNGLKYAKDLEHYLTVNNTPMSYYKITRMLLNDKTVKLSDFILVIEALGYQLKAMVD